MIRMEWLEEEKLQVVDDLGRAYIRGQGRAGCRYRWGKLVLIERGVRVLEGPWALGGSFRWAGPGYGRGPRVDDWTERVETERLQYETRERKWNRLKREELKRLGIPWQ